MVFSKIHLSMKIKVLVLRGVKDDLIGYSHSSEFSIDALKEASRTVSTVKSGHNSEIIVDLIKQIINYTLIKTH